MAERCRIRANRSKSRGEWNKVVREDKSTIRSRRKTLVVASSVVGVALLGGIAFSWWRFVGERTPLFSRSLLPEDFLNALSWSPDGNAIASADQTSLQVWQP
jgi:hypothetical protein